MDLDSPGTRYALFVSYIVRKQDTLDSFNQNESNKSHVIIDKLFIISGRLAANIFCRIVNFSV